MRRRAVMRKEELARELNEKLGVNVNWTKMRKQDLELLRRKLSSVVSVDEINADLIIEKTEDPVGIAIDIISKKGAERLGERVSEILELAKELKIGRGGLIKALRGGAVRNAFGAIGRRQK